MIAYNPAFNLGIEDSLDNSIDDFVRSLEDENESQIETLTNEEIEDLLGYRFQSSGIC